MRIILFILLNGLAVLVASKLLSGVQVDGYVSAIIVGLLLGVVNIFIRPIVTFLTLPITILTLGLFLLVINAAMVLLVDFLMPGFNVSGWIPAILFAIVLWVLNMIIDAIVD